MKTMPHLNSARKPSTSAEPTKANCVESQSLSTLTSVDQHSTIQIDPDSPSSAPRKKRDASTTRASLFEAARRCFVEKGFDATRVDEIAKMAGVNKRMLYVYFGNKEQLYVEVLRRSFEKSIVLGQVQDDPSVHPAVCAKSIITQYFDFVANDPGFVRLVGWENLGERSTKMLADMIAVGLRGLHATFQRGKATNVFRKDLDEQKTVLTVTTLCIGYFSRRSTLKALWGHDLSEPEIRDELLDHIISIVLHGILAPGADEKT